MARTCAAKEGCPRTDIEGHGLCEMHYGRWRRTGKTERSVREYYRADETCLAKDCTNKPHALGYCKTHYGRAWSGNNIDAPIEHGRRPASSLPRFRNCVICGAEFIPYRKDHEVCGQQCRSKWFSIRKADQIKEYLAQPEVRERKNYLRRLETANDPDRVRRANRSRNISRYGLTLDEYEARVFAQGNCCAICGAKPDPNGRLAAGRLHVDHDHETGQLRALLCTRCNQGIGYFADSPGRLRAAADYIDKWRSENSCLFPRVEGHGGPVAPRKKGAQ